jgi:hypothetical protein
VQFKGHEDEINLKNYGMGDEYVAAFAKGLKISSTIRKVNLANNRLNEQGTLKFLRAVHKNVQEIDLSQNKIGAQSIDHICKILKIAS